MNAPRLYPEADPNRPDSPLEAQLRRQLRDVQTRLQAQKQSFEQQLAGLRDRLERQRTHYEGLFNSHLRQIKSELPSLKTENARLMDENQALRAAVDAGIERRSDMMYLLNMLVVTDDNQKLSDDAYDRTMELILRKARTIVSAERLAIQRARNASTTRSDS